MAQTLIVLGTGNALATRCYNTCFAIDFGGPVLLVDAGGGNGILRQLDAAHVDASRIAHIILTHAHCDHMLGLVWMVRKIGTLIRTDKYDGCLTARTNTTAASPSTARRRTNSACGPCARPRWRPGS